MARFIVYTYQFSPVKQFAVDFFDEESKLLMDNFANKQSLLNDLFNSKTKFVFQSYRAKYDYQLLYNKGGVIIIKLANNRHIIQEDNFNPKKLPHNPSCFVIIDNRVNVQRIYIEEKTTAFVDTQQVAGILEYTFCALLKDSHLDVRIKREYDSSEFWQIMEEYDKKIKMLRFQYFYPNLPRVSEKIDETISKISGCIGSKDTVLEFNSGSDEVLDIRKDNTPIDNLVEASSLSGSPIILKIKGMKKHYNVGKVSKNVEIDDLEMRISSGLFGAFPDDINKLLDNILL